VSLPNTIIPVTLILSMPVVLMLMPRIFPTIPVSLRFKFSAAFILILWCLTALGLRSSLWDIGAGVLLILAVLIFAFMIWSVLCWGYTISMLLCLSEARPIKNVYDWEKLYTKSDSILTLTENRSRVLVWLRLAKIHNNTVQLSQLGYRFSTMINTIIRFTGIPL
jgi:hypothetical protein